MQSTKTQTILVVAVLIASCFFIINWQAYSAVGSTPPGSQSTVATTSQSAVSTSAITLFATSSCASRIIQTAASPIMLTFSDKQGTTPTGSLGFIQAASTTVVYDGGLYGCGRVQAYSVAAQTITISETR